MYAEFSCIWLSHMITGDEGCWTISATFFWHLPVHSYKEKFISKLVRYVKQAIICSKSNY